MGEWESGRTVTPESPSHPLPPSRSLSLGDACLRHLQSLTEVTDTFQSAVDAYNRGDLPQAEDICQQILAHTPRDAKALDLRGLIARATGRLDLAIKSLSLAVQTILQIERR